MTQILLYKFPGASILNLFVSTWLGPSLAAAGRSVPHICKLDETTLQLAMYANAIACYGPLQDYLYVDQKLAVITNLPPYAFSMQG